MTRTRTRSQDRPDDVWASRRRHPTAKPVPSPRRSKTFVSLLAIITTLNLIGLVMVLSASSVSLMSGARFELGVGFFGSMPAASCFA